MPNRRKTSKELSIGSNMDTTFKSTANDLSSIVVHSYDIQSNGDNKMHSDHASHKSHRKRLVQDPELCCIYSPTRNATSFLLINFHINTTGSDPKDNVRNSKSEMLFEL